ncbi:hypothetical protein [Dictyobacter formicarum]|uniref:Uncharacterized protein n=1 Tax=Dictyobacter formicarum TaxID=2778368 RepID=A0ABQ3VIN9_9CHLR|nr:hypothetical protein [Dictyobacter formicarum]GHO84991.1 hypothetical protein KSZ_29970 [Dictyobacter formicarum]
MLIEAYLAYSLIPLFYILLGILVYLVLKYSHAPEETQQSVVNNPPAAAQQADADKHQA